MGIYNRKDPGRRRPHALFIPALGIAAVALAAGCSSAGSASSPAAAGGGAGKPQIVIGGIFELSGPDAVFGQGNYQGAKLAIQNINSAGGINGKPVKMLVSDDQSDPATAVAAVRRDISSDHVSIILGPVFSPVALAVAQSAQALKTVFYTPGSAAPQLTQPYQKYIFAPNQTQAVGSAAIAQLVHSMGLKKIGFLEETDSYGQETLPGLKTSLAQYGLSVTNVQTIAADATDATAQMVAFKQAGDQAVISAVTTSPAIASVKAESQQNINLPIFTYGGGSAPAIDALVEADKSLSYYADSPLACYVGNSCTQSALAQFKSAFNVSDPNEFTIAGYEFDEALLNGIKHAPNDTADGIVQGLETMGPYSTPVLAFPVTFNSTTHLGTHNTYLYGIKNGAVDFFGNNINQNNFAK
jgi:branched-chain amino acid transport system substrate-binding protein